MIGLRNRFESSPGFAAGGLRLDWPEGVSRILTEGRHSKLVKAVQQVSYNAPYGRERGQTVLYVTERAVFRPCEGGIEIAEVAPGIDLERDIFAHMGFRPRVAADLKPMDARLFRAEPMGLARDIHARPTPLRARRLSEIGRGA